MAISKNLYTRGLNQKLAGAVWYQRMGETIVRELAANPANPRTSAQMEQRARLTNLVNLYKANRLWMKSGAFEFKKQNWSDYNAFVSANSSIPPVYLTRSMAIAGASIAAPYTVTQGSIPSVQLTYYSDVDSFVSDINVGNLDFDTTDPASDGTTVAELTQAILANNNGIRDLDQLSIIVWHNTVANDNTPQVLVRAYELILNTQDQRPITQIIGRAGLLTLPQSGQKLAFTFPSSSTAVAFVISRSVGGKINVSTETMVLDDAALDLYYYYQTSAAYAAYLNSYASEGDNFLASGYSGIGSSGNVLLNAQLLRVNNVSPGQYLADIEPGSTITMVFNAPLTPATISSGVVGSIQYGENQTYGIPTALVTAQGTTWSIAYPSEGTQRLTNIRSIRVGTAEAGEIVVNFSPNPYGGDVTE